MSFPSTWFGSTALRMGDALFRDHPVLVMPDTSLVFACLRVDGIAGCDLLRWCAVRMPNADSTITVTDDVRTLGLPAADACRAWNWAADARFCR